MNSLFIEHTEDTPEINFNCEKNIFEISKRSLPENAIEFFEPVMDWVSTNLQQTTTPLFFDFKLEYFNTASAKQIAKLFILLQRLSKNTDIKIRWYFDKDDTDMKISGSRYAKLTQMNFDLIENEIVCEAELEVQP